MNMKRYGYLYPKVYDMDNIREAHHNARRGKSHYRDVQRIDADPERYFKRIHYMLKNQAFHNSKYKVFRKYDSGKERVIYRLPYFPDRIIHHAIMQVVEPIWIPTLINDTYACIKGRGIHKGLNRIQKALRNDPEGTRYCLKCDVQKFYPSVDHDILKSIIRKKIKDPQLLWLLDIIIDSAPGIPIGNYLSQHFGNLYLSPIDHYMKTMCGYYYRYCDDIVVLHKHKTYLHEFKNVLSNRLHEMKLLLKSNWQVFPVFIRGIDFLGYRMFHQYTLLRKSTSVRFQRHMNRLKTQWHKTKPIRVISTVVSYYGWASKANCHNLMKRCIDGCVKTIVRCISGLNDMRCPLSKMAI